MHCVFGFRRKQTIKLTSYYFKHSNGLHFIVRVFRLTIIIFFILIIPVSINAQSDSLKTDTTQVQFEMQKSPWGAVLRSAIIPGLGQIYNESYYKVPIIWAIGGWLIYNWIDNNNLKNDYADLYIQTGNENYRILRTTFQDRRDEFAIYMGLVYFLNLIDAYVDAHLFDFSVEDIPSTGESFLQLSMRINF